MPDDDARGSIYDLGYRGYDGVRLGRDYAVFSLYLSSLRGAFGLGRRTSSKIFPIGLAVLTFIPAIIQLGIGALSDNVIELFHAWDYYGYTQAVLALFCAAVAPELVGRDQRTKTLSLYFSRSMQRLDYAAAKFGALTTAMLFLTLGPQLVLFIGNGMAANDLQGYFTDEWHQIAPIVGSAVLLSAFMGSISLVIAAQTPRRAYSTVAILAAFTVTWIVAQVVAETVERVFAIPIVLLSPAHVMRGFTLFLFDAAIGIRRPGEGSVARLDIPGWLFLVTAMAWTALAAFLLYRRYERIDA
jgi:ABC-2 type transport system permease protein